MKASALKTLLKKRRDEVGRIRDKLRSDLQELEALADSCSRAYDDLDNAVEALSEYA